MKNNPYLIFDFDGTLVDSFYAVIEKFNLLAEEHHFRKIQADEIEKVRNLTSNELVMFLQIPFYKIPRVLRAGRELMHKEMQNLLPFKHLPEILRELHANKIPFGILTSNASKNVTAWLEQNKLKHFFNFIHVESNFFGKKNILKKILKKFNLEKSEVYYIGDETRDIEAAKACKIYSVAVTWGFNSEKILSRHKPHYIVRKPEDILAIYHNENTNN